MSEPLDLAPIEARLAGMPEGDARSDLAACVAEIKRLRGQANNDADDEADAQRMLDEGGGQP